MAPRSFTTARQLQRHQGFLEAVCRSRRPLETARRGSYSQVRALLGALCSVIFSDIPADEVTRLRVARSRAGRRLKDLPREALRRLLATRDLEKYFCFLEGIGGVLKDILSNVFAPPAIEKEAEPSSTVPETVAAEKAASSAKEEEEAASSEEEEEEPPLEATQTL